MRKYKVPNYNLEPLKPVYNIRHEGPITYRQKNLIFALSEERNLIVPDDIDTMTKTEAALLIDHILNN